MSTTWPQDTIRELLVKAQNQGRAIAQCSTKREAELFRFAIYSFIKRKDFDNDFLITIDGTNVVVDIQIFPRVEIL
jgi:hypothetical protein